MNTTNSAVSEWVRRTETVHDPLATTQARAVAAMLDDDASMLDVGAVLPRLWHWFHFLPRAVQSQLDRDGHPARGGFLPPIALPRRMFAGARVRWHAPLTLGVAATREGEILDVRHKEGRSGTLAFVTVRYRVHQGGTLCVEEEQDIVYREAGVPVAAPDVLEWAAVGTDVAVQEVHPDSRLLFRFSALTFNAHRIHYDRDYARSEEGYPGLVVHGPLQALLLLRLAESRERVARGAEARAVQAFSFRGLAPAFDTGPIRLHCMPEGNTAALAAERCDGVIALRAEVRFAE